MWLFKYLIFFLFISKVPAFYLPGLAPMSYCRSKTDGCPDTVPIFVNRLNSLHTVLPYEYDKFDFCKADHVEPALKLNLGQTLFGERIRLNSLYQLSFGQPEWCHEVCAREYKPNNKTSLEKLDFLREAVKNNYYHNWIVDNMPITWCYRIADTSDNRETFCVRGFPIGCYVSKDGQRSDNCVILQGQLLNNTYYLFNHLDITVRYHRNEDMGGSKITSIKVQPKSCRNQSVCKNGKDEKMFISGEPLAESLTIRYYYSITWKEDKETKWASRWDYILIQSQGGSIHWFSIINSFIVLAFMTATLIGFVIRALKRDVARSNQLKDSEDALGKYDKWRLLHGDVFRPPRYGMILSALCGSGIQVLFMTMITIQFAAFGLLSPANRGALGTCSVVLFTLAGFPAGVASARVFKRFGGEKWKTNSVVTALLCPGFMFVLYMVFNIIWWSQGSSAALPVTAILALLGLWLGISLPLTFVGAFLGYRRGNKFPSAPFNEMPRPVPKRSIVYKTFPGMVIGGILPFGCLYIESFFIMNSIWQHQAYYVYGFLLLVYIILLVTCAESTVLLCYFHLCAQDYHWWWRSFLSGGFCGIYVFLYSINYYFKKMELVDGASIFLYFGYMFMISFVIFLLTGSVGFFTCFWFIKKIYSVVK